MGHQVQFRAAEDRQSSLAGHELVQELIVGTHAVLFSPQCIWSSWSRDLLLERLETLLTLQCPLFLGWFVVPVSLQSVSLQMR